MSRRFTPGMSLDEFRAQQHALRESFLVRLIETRRGGETSIAMETTETDFEAAVRRADKIQEGVDARCLPQRAFVMNPAGTEVLHAGGAPRPAERVAR